MDTQLGQKPPEDLHSICNFQHLISGKFFKDRNDYDEACPAGTSRINQTMLI